MRKTLIAVFLFVSTASVASAGELRCGWYEDPTPANAWLTDRDATWIIGVQGGYQARGDWPDFTKKQWVRTNGDYGHGCACIHGIFDHQTKRVVNITSAQAQTLTNCREDHALKEPRA